MPRIEHGIEIREAGVIDGAGRVRDMAYSRMGDVSVSVSVQPYVISNSSRAIYMMAERREDINGNAEYPFYANHRLTPQAALELARELHAAAVQTLEFDEADAHAQTINDALSIT